jgi:hypothetical protein
MGKVITQGKTTSRFVIQDKLGLYLIALIFNGNIRTPEKLKSLNIFLESLNTKISSLNQSRKLKEFNFTNKDNLFHFIYPINQLYTFDLNDPWFIGFVDAEGCFHVNFNKSNNTFKILFDLAQKGENNKIIILDKLIDSLGIGKVYKHSQDNVWYYRINGLNDNGVVIDYFDNFHYTFLTKKYNSYLLWKFIHNAISNKEHLDPIIRHKLIILSKLVNKSID